MTSAVPELLSHLGNFVPAEGPAKCRIAFVGEAPGEEEDRLRRPFVGKSGILLWEMVRLALGMTRSQIFTTNLVPQHPPNNRDPKPDEIDHWGDFLVEQLVECQADIIVCLGRISAGFLIGREISMEESNGLAYRVVLHTPNSTELPVVAVIPVVHPAAGLRSSDYLNDTMDGLAAVIQAWQGNPPWAPQEAGMASVVVDETFLNILWPHGPRVVAVDTEGSPEHPHSMSLCIGQNPMVVGAGILHHTPIPDFLLAAEEIVLHNALWDWKVLRAMGIDLTEFVARGGKVTDTKVLAHNHGRVSTILKPVARGIFGLPMQDFEDMIQPLVDKYQREWLEGIVHGVPPPQDTVVPGKILKNGKQGKPKTTKGKPSPLYKAVNLAQKALLNGQSVDLENRYKSWTSKGILDDSLGSSFPLKSKWESFVTTEDIAPYSGLDAYATFLFHDYLKPLRSDPKHQQLDAEDNARLPLIDRMMHMGFPINLEKVERLIEQADITIKAATEALQMIAPERQWSKESCIFNPQSGDQVCKLLFEDLKLPPPRKMTDSGSRYKVDEEALAGYVGHPIVEAIKVIRGSVKRKSTYLLPMSQSKKGRFYHSLQHCNTVSGRLAGLMLTIPVHSDEAKDILDCFEAPQGRLLGSWDMSQIEYRVMADESKDENAMEAYRTGSDLHKKTMALFGVPRIKAKTINFRILYGGQARAMAEGLGIPLNATEEERERLIAEAAEYIRKWYEGYPGVANAIYDTYAKARRDGYIEDRWGRRRYSAAVRLEGRQWPLAYLRAAGEREMWSLRVQGGATGCMRKAELQVWNKVLPEIHAMGYYCEPILQRHDELIMEFDWAAWPYLDGMMKEAMVAAQPWFEVPLKCESAVGQTWAQLKD